MPQAAAQPSVESRLALQIRLLLDTWTARVLALPPGVFEIQNREAWLELAGHWTAPQLVDPLRHAVARGDLRALAALIDLEHALAASCEPLLERIAALRAASDWRSVQTLARLSAAAAAAAGRFTQLAQSLEHSGAAARKLGNDAAAVTAYRQALAAAPTRDNAAFLALTHEALGDTLDEILDFEEARQHYECAAALNPDAARGAQLLRKRANELIRLGEYRSATQEFTAQIQGLRATGLQGIELGRSLDMAAQALLEMGAETAALPLIREAREHMPTPSVADLATNFELEARVHLSAGRLAAASEAFERAWELAVERARAQIDPGHYRRGFTTALAQSLPQGDEAFALFERGIRDRQAGNDEAAFARWQQAADRAYRLHDHGLWLRVQANVVAFFTDRGDVDQAVEIGVRTTHQARERGLARPEFMSLTTLARLAATGAEIPESEGYVFAYARALVLLEMHTAMMAQFDFTPSERLLETGDAGQLDHELAMLFTNFGSMTRAASHFRRAIDKARVVDFESMLVNRICGLVGVLDPEQATEERRRAVAEIRALVESPKLLPRGRLVALKTLALEDGASDRSAAVGALSTACHVMEAYRRTLPIAVRADYDRDFSDMPRWLATMYRVDGRIAQAFDTLQLVKGRRLVDALVSRTGDATASHAGPLSVHELAGLLPRAGDATYVVDLAVEPDDRTIAAYIVGVAGVRVVTACGDHSVFARVNGCDVQEREARIAALCLESVQLRELAAKIVAAVPTGSNLLIVPDGILHQLPLHAIPVQGEPWVQLTPITYAPTAAILRFGPTSVPRRAALVAGDSKHDLAGAERECIEIGRALGVSPLLGKDCTRAALVDALRDGAPAIVHLAVHGRADARFGSRAAILVADGAGGAGWLEFRRLKSLPWTARLVVFSGCSTGAVGLLHGTQLASVAAAALETGVGTVIASLWPVNDDYARIFMEEFYAGLVAARARTSSVDLRPLVAAARDQVRAAVNVAPQTRRRDGRNLGEAAEVGARALDGLQSQIPEDRGEAVPEEVAAVLAWAPFCVFGSPIVEFTGVGAV